MVGDKWGTDELGSTSECEEIVDIIVAWAQASGNYRRTSNVCDG